MTIQSLCVFCGSSSGHAPEYAAAEAAFGRLLAERNIELIYGGGRVGLMGTLADASLAAGGRVVGVIPEALASKELAHQGCTELLVVGSMHERKALLAERSDAFIALPGGIGTFEELFEVWSWRQLGYHDKPLGLLNVAGYYDPLLAFLEQCKAHGFMSSAQTDLLSVGTEPQELLQRLAELAGRATLPDDYRRI